MNMFNLCGCRFVTFWSRFVRGVRRCSYHSLAIWFHFWLCVLTPQLLLRKATTGQRQQDTTASSTFQHFEANQKHLFTVFRIECCLAMQIVRSSLSNQIEQELFTFFALKNNAHSLINSVAENFNLIFILRIHYIFCFHKTPNTRQIIREKNDQSLPYTRTPLETFDC